MAKSKSQKNKKTKIVTQTVVVNKKTKRAKKKNPNKVRSIGRTGVASFLNTLSPCTRHYFANLAAPFDPKSEGVCVPTFPARKSMKTSSKARGTLTVGTNRGYIAVVPCVANDNPSIYYSNSASYAGTAISIIPNTMPAGSTSAAVPNPNNSAVFVDGTAAVNSTLTARIVSVGLRVRYTGTELNKSGLMYMLVQPDHGNLNGFNENNMANYKECVIKPVSREWTEIVLSAIDTHETEYPDSGSIIGLAAGGSSSVEGLTMLYPFSQGQYCDSSSPHIGAVPMAVICTGVAGNTFDWEVITHLETVGPTVQNMSTKSHSDIEGLSKVTSVVGDAAGARGANPNLSQAAAFAKAAYDHVSENKKAYSTMASVAGNILFGDGGSGWTELVSSR